MMKRARFAFIGTSWNEVGATELGNRAVSVMRSLALRPCLTTGLPWTEPDDAANIAVERTLGRPGHHSHPLSVLVEPERCSTSGGGAAASGSAECIVRRAR